MRLEIHTLAWPNTHPGIVKAHSDVCKHLQLEVTTHIREVPHGQWMNEVMATSTADVVGFLDIDCIPLNAEIVEQSYIFAAKHTMVGIAQASNHIPPYSHIFAAPAFLFVNRKVWNDLHCPTFSETEIGDVAENVSYALEMAGLRYKTLYPTHYTKAPAEGLWHLHTYGVYGIGTVFEGGVYHLYQARVGDNAELFIQTCEQVIAGTFTTDNMMFSR